MSQVKRVLELTDGNSRMLRVEVPQNSRFMLVTIGRLCVTLDPAAQEELWYFLTSNKVATRPEAAPSSDLPEVF